MVIKHSDWSIYVCHFIIKCYSNEYLIKVPRKEILACDNIPTDEIDMVKQCGKDTVLSTVSHCYSDHVEMQYSCEKRGRYNA